MHSLIHSILDYCNSTFGALTETQIRRLQKIQNAGARFICGLHGTNRRQAITPYLKDLHFLPIRHRIEYKIALMVFKCMNNIAPKYLSSLIELHTTNRYSTRRDTDFFLLKQPPLPRVNKTNGAFFHSGPRIWNGLPLSLRSMNNLGLFKTALKTYLFRRAFSDPINRDDVDYELI